MFNSEIKSLPNEDICILIKPENHSWNYICECGDARNLTVKEVQNTNAVFISHTHIDHFVNFDAIIRHQIGIQRRVVIVGPEGIAQQVQAKLRSYTWNLIEKGAITYEIREVIDENETKVYEVEPPTWDLKPLQSTTGNVVFKESSFEVSWVALDHKIPTLAFRFQEKDTVKIDIKTSGFRGGKWVNDLKIAFEKGLAETVISVDGKDFQAKELFHLLHIKTGDSLGVIMDHAAHIENHTKIKAHFNACEKVYIECFYKEEDKAQAEANFHSYSKMSGKVMQAAKVMEAIPVHFSRKYNEDQIKELIDEFEKAFLIQKRKIMWFERLTGFREESPEQVRKHLKVEGERLVSSANGKSFHFGRLETPSLEEFRKQMIDLKATHQGKLKVSEIVGNVQNLHKAEENAGALFQAASQFNLLEMVGPDVIPERGVSIYAHDYTQGPACAIACGAGTIYRNYFAEVNGKIGQTANNQIDCLEDIGKALKNKELGLWRMRNGYALATKDGLRNITKQIEALSNEERETLKGKLKIGLQWDTEVTVSETKHKVSQAYCSALPVAYSMINAHDWEAFARVVLEATYEATLSAALVNLENTGSNKVFLTMVGGGVFGNETNWIVSAMKKAFQKFADVPLDVRIVSYGGSKPVIQSLIKSVSA